MALALNRRVMADPQGYTVNLSGDVRPVYVTACPLLPIMVNDYLMTVPMGYAVNLSGDVRPIEVSADCADGGLSAGEYVQGVPQGYSVSLSGDERPIYVTSCCPTGGGSSSSGVLTGCCPGIPIPDTLKLVFSNGTPGCASLDGITITLTYNASFAQWFGQYSSGTSSALCASLTCSSTNAMVLSAGCIIGTSCFGFSGGLIGMRILSCDPFHATGTGNPTCGICPNSGENIQADITAS